MNSAFYATKIGKWLGVPLGVLMYIRTVDSFGSIVAVILSLIAAVSFWLIVKGEENHIVSREIVNEIQLTISEIYKTNNFIEIKRFRHGIIARIYLINAKEKLSHIQAAVSRNIENSKFGRHILAMQMTDISGIEELPKAQKILNDELINALLLNKDDDFEEK